MDLREDSPGGQSGASHEPATSTFSPIKIQSRFVAGLHTSVVTERALAAQDASTLGSGQDVESPGDIVPQDPGGARSMIRIRMNQAVG